MKRHSSHGDRDGGESVDPIRRRLLVATITTVGSAGCLGGGDAATTPEADTGTGTGTTESRGSASIATTSRVLSVPRGDVVGIPISLSNTARTRLELGSGSLDYHVSMDVHDRSGDGRVTVRWETGIAGQTTAPSDAFSAAGAADEVTNVTRSTGPLAGPLAADSYPLSLRVAGTETGLGTVSVTRPTDTATPTRRSSPSPREPTDTPAGRVLEQGEGVTFDAVAVQWSFRLSDPATVSITFENTAGYPVDAYTMPPAEVGSFLDGEPGGFEYVEELSFPASTGGSARADLQPGDYVFVIENDEHGQATPPTGADDPVVDFTIRLV